MCGLAWLQQHQQPSESSQINQSLDWWQRTTTTLVQATYSCGSANGTEHPASQLATTGHQRLARPLARKVDFNDSY